MRWLAGVLIAIDITLAGLFWAMAPEDVLARLIKKTLYIGAFALIVSSYNNLAQIIYNSFAGLGIEAGRGAINVAMVRGRHAEAVHEAVAISRGRSTGTGTSCRQHPAAPQFF